MDRETRAEARAARLTGDAEPTGAAGPTGDAEPDGAAGPIGDTERTGADGPDPTSLPDREPTDPDIDLHVAQQRTELRHAPWQVLGTISAGGVAGALGRYAISVALPRSGAGFPWATFLVNVTGCLLLGLLMVLITEVWTAHPLIRPFLGVGVLGGYTTFSTAMVDTQQLVAAGAAGTALLYLFGTVAAAVAATALGILLGRGAARTGAPTRDGGHR